MSRRADAAVALARRQTAKLDAFGRRTGAQLGEAFVTVGGLDDDALEQFLELAVPAAEASETTAVYGGAAMVRALAQLYGRPVDGGRDLRLTDLIGPALRDGATYADTWTWPMVMARSAISDGEDFPAALDAGRTSAFNLARTNVGDAMRAGSTATAAATKGVESYNRVPSPGACEFCLTISTRRYYVEDLAPVHRSCGCGVMPVFGVGDEPADTVSEDASQDLSNNSSEGD